MFAFLEFFQFGYGFQPESGNSSPLWGIIILLLFLAFLVFLLIRFTKNRSKVVTFAHWHHSYEGLQLSVRDFYQAVTDELKTKGLRNVAITRVNHHEGSVLSAEREYLRLRRAELVSDICVAPFGPGFFASIWLGVRPTAFQILISTIPFMGGWLVNKLIPNTYYRRDSTLMYEETVRKAVQDVLDRNTTAKGLRALTESERKPFLNDKFFA